VRGNKPLWYQKEEKRMLMHSQTSQETDFLEKKNASKPTEFKKGQKKA